MVLITDLDEMDLDEEDNGPYTFAPATTPTTREEIMNSTTRLHVQCTKDELASRTLVLTIISMLLGIFSRISLPKSWYLPKIHGSVRPFDPEYDARLCLAAEGLKDRVFGDNLGKTHKALLSYGLVCLADNSAPTASLQTQTARAIAILLEEGGVSLDTGGGAILTRRSELELVVAAHRYQARIILFSSRKQPHEFKPVTTALFTVGLVQLKDQSNGASKTMALVCSRTKPVHRPQPPPKPPLVPKYQAATWRPEPRPVSRNQYDHSQDEDCFHKAW